MIGNSRLEDKVLSESVQHRLTRMIPGLAKMSYKDILEYLGLWSLEERSNRSDRPIGSFHDVQEIVSHTIQPLLHSQHIC